MAATASKSRTAASKSRTAPKARQKSVKVPVKKAPRAKRAASAVQVKAVPAAATVANDEIMMQEIEAMPMVEALPQVRVADNDDRILLPARMELAALDEAHQLLQSKYPPVSAKYILDGALLNVIDMAGIQLLIGFIRSMTAKGCKIEWDNYSVQMYQLASELGVTSQLGD